MRNFLKATDPAVPVPKPDGSFLDAAGEEVTMSVYWHRRLNDGSVTRVQPEEPAPAVEEKPIPAPVPEKPKKPATRRSRKEQSNVER